MANAKLLNTGLGIGLIVLGIALQQLFEPYYLQVFIYTEQGIIQKDTGPLILGGGLLAFINAIIYLPIFLGAFKAGQIGVNTRRKRWLSLIIVLTLTICAFLILSWLNRDKLYLTGAILVVVMGYLLITELANGELTYIQQAAVLLQLILASQWLELTPYLNYLGFGRGDLSSSIQIAASFLNSTNVLNFVGPAFFIPLTLSAGATTILINSYSQRLAALAETKKKQEELQKVRLQAIEARVSQEMHSLVHDLKTPLTTIRGLNSILELQAASDKQQSYCQKIDLAVGNMNEMTSEILYDEVRSDISVEKLINYVRAHVVSENLPQEVTFDLETQLPSIRVNKIRMARALINIIENALKATENKENGFVHLTVKKYVNGDNSDHAGVVFKIEDNGVGIEEMEINKIWQVKYSTGNTPGLGLDFVKKVVETHQGKVTITSVLGKGTEVDIYLGEEK